MREGGYYWVKYDGNWYVAQYYVPYTIGLSFWLLPGSLNDYEDSEFEEIDEKRLTHE